MPTRRCCSTSLTGSHAGDRFKPPPPQEPYAASAARAQPGTLRIALALGVPFSGAPAKLHRDVRAQVERIAGVLTDLGHDVFYASPFYGLVGAAFMPRSMSGVRGFAQLAGDDAELDARTRDNARTGRVLGGPLLAVARAAEPLLRAQIGRVFGRADVVLAPTTAQPPLPVGAIDGLSNWQTDKRIVAACPYAWPWNVVGWPGVNVPAGFTRRGCLSAFRCSARPTASRCSSSSPRSSSRPSAGTSTAPRTRLAPCGSRG